MVTVSAVIFIVGANTMVLTTKIKQLEHFEEFNDIFVLSLLILFTNLAVTGIIRLITDGVRKKYKEE
jgi:iron(III) transport system permease protein